MEQTVPSPSIWFARGVLGDIYALQLPAYIEHIGKVMQVKDL